MEFWLSLGQSWRSEAFVRPDKWGSGDTLWYVLFPKGFGLFWPMLLESGFEEQLKTEANQSTDKPGLFDALWLRGMQFLVVRINKKMRVYVEYLRIIFEKINIHREFLEL